MKKNVLRPELMASLLAISGTTALAGPAVQRLSDLNPGSAGSYPSYITEYQGNLYFRANLGLHDVELYRFDGRNVTLAADIHPTSSSTPTDLVVANGLLYFTADDPIGGGGKLWSFDGTTAQRVAAVAAANLPQEMTEYNGKLYFRGTQFGTIGIELFEYDGVAMRSWNIYPGTGSSYPQHFAKFQNSLYFSAGGQAGQGSELWRLTGSTVEKAGQNINPGGGSSPYSMTIYNNALYFGAYEGVNGNELWKFDGSTSTLVADIWPGGINSSSPSYLTTYGDSLYFAAEYGTLGFELFKYDGSTVSLVADINTNAPDPGGDRGHDSFPSELTVHNGKLYFTADDGIHGRELWSYDGTQAVMVADIYPGQYSSQVTGLVSTGGHLYFQADANDGAGRELFWLVPTEGAGDADENGQVDLIDYHMIAENFGHALPLENSIAAGMVMVRVEGDVNYDGVVDFADLRMLKENYPGGPQALLHDLSLIPEPGTFMLGTLAGLLAAVRRRSNRSSI